jgi:superfamily II DNA or RNA helicase
VAIDSGPIGDMGLEVRAYFRENSHSISLRPLTVPNSGFRPGQLGALHAVLSHFSVFEEPAIVSLPTGYGKTAVIMALPFVLEANRLLVVEPSDALRRQTTSHFKTISTLRKINAIPSSTPDPAVKGQKGRPTVLEEWESLRDEDVIVSTPNSTSPLLDRK